MSDQSPNDGVFSLSDEVSIEELRHRVAVAAGIGEEQAETAVRVVQQRSLHIGPHPSAAEITRYNQIEPGLGTRLVESFLTQQERSMQLNDRVIEIAERDATREDSWFAYASQGQMLGFIMALLLLVSALLCAFVLHQYWLAAAFIAAPTIGLVAQFIRGVDRK